MRKPMWIADQGDGGYTNPILYTDYSDPDVIRVGANYYMVASSFCNTPAVPVLHSKDLVNWKVISYVMENLPFEHYDKPLHGLGAWAPSIRFHDGLFYVFIPFPDEGIAVCKTEDPFDKWSEPEFITSFAGWIDPCPLWDDDGQTYMVTAVARSRCGIKSMLYMTPIDEECTHTLGEGQFVFDGHKTQPTIEGPKLYKRNGYYYIFAPAGGVKVGWQTVLRSKDIYGPYEEKIVMRQGITPINGPHQGAWVDTMDGKDYFIHFQDVGTAGRIVHLEPMRWVDDWPIIGDEDAEGFGQPVYEAAKPVLTDDLPYAPDDSDEFVDEKLGLQWQWNANHKDDWYKVGDNRLVLYAQKVEAHTQLCDVPNLLLQKWPAPFFSVNTLFRIDGMNNGDMCGMICLGTHYSALYIEKNCDRLYLKQVVGEMQVAEPLLKTLSLKSDAASFEKMRFIKEVSIDITRFVEMQMVIDEEENIIFYVDGLREPVGSIEKATAGRLVGAKVGLFAINKLGANPGSVDVDYFLFDDKI